MRINFCDDEDFNNQALLWEANQERSIKGRKGQAALRELEAALLALPEKRLIANELENAQGEVCAIGALVKFSGKENPRVGDSFGDHGEMSVGEAEIERITLDLAEALGVPRLVAVAIVYENDDRWEQTPEQRYERILRWVQHALSGQYGWVTKPKAH
jgi:hypothetical protein